jgi:hypothetical protein
MQFDEQDVIGLAALDLNFVNEKIGDSGTGDAGVLVTISNGIMQSGAGMGDGTPVDFNAPSVMNDYLGEDFNSKGLHVYGQSYPSVSYTVKPFGDAATDFALGFTMQQTAKYDENGEKLLYYRDKARAMHIALPGETVRVVTKGLLTFHESAFEVAPTAVGEEVFASDAGNGGEVGKITSSAGAVGPKVGRVIGMGARTASGNPIADPLTGGYFLVKVEL